MKTGRESEGLEGNRQRRLGATDLSLQHRYRLAKGFPRRRFLGNGLLRASEQQSAKQKRQSQGPRGPAQHRRGRLP